MGHEGGQPAEGVHLEPTDENVAEIDALAERLGGRVGLDGLLADLPRRLRPSLVGRLAGRAVTEAYAWDAADQRDPRWYPQGITTSADAEGTDDVAGHRLLVTTWYARKVDGMSQGARISVVDLDTLHYRHVLLVVPVLDEEGRLQLRPLRAHAGGIVWAGPYLHVAATARGFHTFRVDDLMALPGAEPGPDTLGFATDGRAAAYGYRYVLPMRFSYGAFTDDGHERLRYSFLSLDRDSEPPMLVAGEYGRGEQTTRLARYPLDARTGRLASNADGWSRPVSLEGGVGQMQGAVVARGRYHVTASRGPWRPGSVYVGTPPHWRRHRFATPMGPEDLAYWPSTDRLWTLTEHPRRRWIVSMRRSWFA